MSTQSTGPDPADVTLVHYMKEMQRDRTVMDDLYQQVLRHMEEMTENPHALFPQERLTVRLALYFMRGLLASGVAPADLLFGKVNKEAA